MVRSTVQVKAIPSRKQTTYPGGQPKRCITGTCSTTTQVGCSRIFFDFKKHILEYRATSRLKSGPGLIGKNVKLFIFQINWGHFFLFCVIFSKQTFEKKSV
jgi:hypothetical protein